MSDTPSGIIYIGEFSSAPSPGAYATNTVYKNTSNGFYYARGTTASWDLYFWPSIQPNPGGVDKEVNFRTIRSSFGDGYKQIAPDGINNIVDQWNLSWESLSIQESREIEDFFVATNGLPFRWSPIGETVVRKYTVGKLSKKRSLSLYDSISVSLERDFSP
mgnify:CR=1 FL=1